MSGVIKSPPNFPAAPRLFFLLHLLSAAGRWAVPVHVLPKSTKRSAAVWSPVCAATATPTKPLVTATAAVSEQRPEAQRGHCAGLHSLKAHHCEVRHRYPHFTNETSAAQRRPHGEPQGPGRARPCHFSHRTLCFQNTLHAVEYGCAGHRETSHRLHHRVSDAETDLRRRMSSPSFFPGADC